MKVEDSDEILLSQLPDLIVVERVINGEKELFEILLRRYNQRLFRVVRCYISRDDDVQDIMQDAYIKAYTKLEQFHNESSFSTWLIRIGINEALQFLRKSKHQATNYSQTASLESFFELPDTDEMSPEKQIISDETRLSVEHAVDLLPEKYKVVFVMHQIEGLSNPEIAASLNLTDSNVKVRLHRAKNILKDELFKGGDHDASIFEFGNHKCDAMVDGVIQRIQNL